MWHNSAAAVKSFQSFHSLSRGDGSHFAGWKQVPRTGKVSHIMSIAAFAFSFFDSIGYCHSGRDVPLDRSISSALLSAGLICNWHGFLEEAGARQGRQSKVWNDIPSTERQDVTCLRHISDDASAGSKETTASQWTPSKNRGQILCQFEYWWRCQSIVYDE